jgi:integrase
MAQFAVNTGCREWEVCHLQWDWEIKINQLPHLLVFIIPPVLESGDYSQMNMWRDYFLLILFTGMRKTETASIRWRDVDLESKTFTLQDTKQSSLNI